jgi:hypothetical protein
VIVEKKANIEEAETKPVEIETPKEEVKIEAEKVELIQAAQPI